LVSSSTPLGSGCNRSHYIAFMAQWSTRRNQVIFAVLDVSWTMGLNSDKTSKVFFVLIFAVFLPDFILFLYHNGTVIHVASQLWMFLISTPHKTRTFTVRLAVTTNTKETVLQQMCCLDPRGVPIGPIVRGVIACPILGRWWDVTTQVVTQSSIGRRVMVFRIFSNNDRPPFWILKILIFDHVTVIIVRICCCIPNLIKIGSAFGLHTPTTAECPVRRC